MRPAGYLGMWMATMVPMMLPSLVPMLWRYRRSVGDVGAMRLNGLTAVVGAGYYAVWAVAGAAAWAASAGIMAAEMRWGNSARWVPMGAGAVLLAVAVLQFTSWKMRQLALCRAGPGCASAPARGAPGALWHGIAAGMRCGLCCGNLMLALLVVGMMQPVAMAAAAIAISAERLAPVPVRVARVAGAVLAVAGVLTIARA
jgi:predicted metal-binding membrane protein